MERIDVVIFEETERNKEQIGTELGYLFERRSEYKRVLREAKDAEKELKSIESKIKANMAEYLSKE